MTILVCQKRHHEPHEFRNVFGDLIYCCDGLPRWPYARPKPPPISDVDASIEYAAQHNIIVVLKGSKPDQWTADLLEGAYDTFPTHTEAIMYAQKLAQERKQQNGMVQGR